MTRIEVKATARGVLTVNGLLAFRLVAIEGNQIRVTDQEGHESVIAVGEMMMVNLRLLLDPG